MAYEVPPLPYDYAALEPHIDEATMRVHHDKHHQAYVDKANAALEGTEEATRPALGSLLASGVAGTAAIPGKHGGPAVATASVYVALPDHPGELGRLFADVGASGVNIEDVRIDHDPGRPVGQVELLVAEPAVRGLSEALGERGWAVHG